MSDNSNSTVRLDTSRSIPDMTLPPSKSSDNLSRPYPSHHDIQHLREEFKAGVSTISSFWSEFKDYIESGEIIDNSISIVAGRALTEVVNSFVSDLIVPFFAAIIGRPNLANFFLVLKQGRDIKARYRSVKQAQDDGATVLPFGKFFQKTLNFVFLGFSLVLCVRTFQTLLFTRRRIFRDAEEATSQIQKRLCPFCYTKIHKSATRCPQCTSQVPSQWIEKE